jgi:hypothetical protein
MRAAMTVDSWEAWSAADYVRDYYGRSVEPDEQAALEFQIAFLRRHDVRFSRAVEYGCGPTLMRAIAAAPYVEAIDMADRLEENLTRVRRWASGEPGADDWSHFTRYILRCEGIAAPSPDQIAARERQTRRAIAGVIASDALEPRPLGPERTASHDLLLSGFCLDCLSQSRDVWRACMRNVFGAIRPGGSFVVLALRRCEAYRVGNRWFPCANIGRSDLESALIDCGVDPSRTEVAERDLPAHADQGYEGILMACGQVLA